MERFGRTYDGLSGVYSELENIMGSVYEELQLDPSNERNANLLQGLGSVALKVLSSQRELVENYGDKDLKDSLLSNIDSKTIALSNALSQDRNRTR